MITQTDGRPRSSDEELPPFPEGWYFVATRDSILREKLIEKTWMGQEIVVWCDDEGRVCVSDAYCPHLGSHLGMDSRLWVLATPVDGSLVEVVLVSQVREIRKPGRFFAGLRFLPVAIRHRVMNRIVLSEERRFVLQEVVIWERKKYQAPPRLSQADGPVGKYRQYSRQFYPELESERRPTLRAI